MVNVLIGAISSVAKTLIVSFISERVIMLTAYKLLEKLSKSTTNTIDDRALKLVGESLEAKGWSVK